ncbi:MAG: glycosyltransferase family 2 protein [Cytophagales bacterium]
MKISCYTYVRNASTLGYPFIESILSVLPICEEFVIALGDGNDDTENMILAINSSKIKIIHTVWEMNNLKDGTEFSRQAEIALKECTSDWVLHLQCDEVIHEEDLPLIKKTIDENNSNSNLQGFLFEYLHFYGNYHYICASPQWYRREIRLFRNNIGVKPYRDSQGFRINNKKLLVIKTKIRVFHYSRVSNPILFDKKMKAFKAMYNQSTSDAETSFGKPVFEQNGELLKYFQGQHPHVMQSRISNLDWIFNYDPKKASIPFKYKFKLFFEKLTGYLPFEYKNYQLIE